MFKVITKHMQHLKLECSECKTQFAVDLDYEPIEDNVRREGDKMFFKCPSCKHETDEVE